LDVHLPDASGFDVCQRIKKDPHTAHIPVLQISASFVSGEDKAKALEAGADSYLTHPIDAVVLVATVRSLLRLRAAEGLARESSVQWQSTFDALSEGLALVSSRGELARFNHAFSQLCANYVKCEIGSDAASILRGLLGSDAPLRHTGDERYSAEFLVENRTFRVTVDRVTVGTADFGKILVLTLTRSWHSMLSGPPKSLPLPASWRTLSRTKSIIHWKL
jgi:response regulator of citrate/malate metabolism